MGNQLKWTEEGEGYYWTSQEVSGVRYEILKYNPGRYSVGTKKPEAKYPFAKAGNLSAAKEAAERHLAKQEGG